jgi:hypothetical protein
MGQPEGQFPPPDTAAPSTARIYNYLIGGDIHHPPDRAAAGRILADFPEFAQLARANREFVIRAVHYVATQGVIQFIDLGTGLPVSPAVHETAWRASPGARVAYVDHDPLVLEHARAAAAGHPDLAVVPGDLRQPDGILAHPELRRIIDPRSPVCLVLASVLHLLPPEAADAVVAGFRSVMTAGSYLVVSSGTSTGTSPAFIERLRRVYAHTSDITGRPREEIAAWFTGLELVPPGLADVQLWPADQGHAQARPPARMLGAVGRRPARGAPARLWP